MELKHITKALYESETALLLIVPYGIETRVTWCLSVSQPLLIVPYGIETSTWCPITESSLAFNRTLWN